MSDYKKPLPTIHPWTVPFWEGARQGKLMLQKGKTTGKYIMYPKKYSPYDYREELEWVEASGKGKIYSYSIVYANVPSYLEEDLPFVVAIVELDEGVRMCSNIVETDFEKIKIGAPVSVVYQPATEEVTLVQFKVTG